MATSREIREQRASLVAQSKDWLTKAEQENTKSPEEIDLEWGKRMQEIDDLEVQARSLERKEKLASVESDLKTSQGRKSNPTNPYSKDRNPVYNEKQERKKAFKNWLGYGLPGRSNFDGDSVNRAAQFGMPLHQNSIEYRTGILTSSGGAGGYAAAFVTETPDIQSQLKYYSPIVGKVHVETTSDGNNFIVPQDTDTANSVGIIGQGSSITEADPTFTKVTLGSYMYRTIVTVSYEMLQDSIFDVEAFVNDTLAIRFARTAENAIVAGTGSSQPTGLLTAAVSAGNVFTLAATHKSFYQFQDLMSLFQLVDLAYRPNCTLVLNDTSVWDLRKITDSNGRFIWDINNTLVQNAQPDKIAGFNYLVSNSIPASNAFSTNLAVFADLSRHWLRMVDGLQMRRLNELYAASGLIGIECLMRFDCNYIGHSTSISYAATPSS